jgi:hypothetical protein
VNEPVTPPILQTIGPRLGQLRQAIVAATGAPRANPQETEAKADGPAAEPAAADAPIDSPPSGPQPARGTAGTNRGNPIGTGPANPTGTSTNAVPVPDSDASRPGDMIEALDVGSRPVFSPSFAVDGSAIFFDQDNAAGGSAL